MRTFNFATYYDINTQTYPRKEQTLKMLKSIEGQFDKVRCYFNNVRKRPEWLPEWVEIFYGEDLTDLGKFYFLKPDINEFYFTGDDDLYYPPTYADDMVKAIGENKCIVTHHGRKLIPNAKDYYRSHPAIRCLDVNHEEKFIDVAGTGVMAFNTRYFNPYWIIHSKDRKMSDLTFALECAKHGKKIIGLKHSKDYIKYLYPQEEQTIHAQMVKNQTRLIEVATQIYNLNNA